jgi:hypothetical protein
VVRPRSGRHHRQAFPKNRPRLGSQASGIPTGMQPPENLFRWCRARRALNHRLRFQQASGLRETHKTGSRRGLRGGPPPSVRLLPTRPLNGKRSNVALIGLHPIFRYGLCAVTHPLKSVKRNLGTRGSKEPRSKLRGIFGSRRRPGGGPSPGVRRLPPNRRKPRGIEPEEIEKNVLSSSSEEKSFRRDLRLLFGLHQVLLRRNRT